MLQYRAVHSCAMLRRDKNGSNSTSNNKTDKREESKTGSAASERRPVQSINGKDEF